MQVGFIGLGAMGWPMATNLHAKGLLAALWNRTATKAQTLAKETGCTAAANPSALASACDLIITCVAADDDLLAVVDALIPGLRDGAVVADCSTVSRTTACTAAERLRARGAAFLDCPVSGGVEGARAGTLVIMAGGDAGALERARPALAAFSRRIVHMGPIGHGQAAKAVNQAIAAGVNQAVTEGLAFGAALGLPPEALIEAVGSGAAASWFLQQRGPSMAEGRFSPGFKVALHDKDLAICQTMAADLGMRLPVVEMTRHHYRRLMDAGYGDEDISALYRLKCEMPHGGKAEGH